MASEGALTSEMRLSVRAHEGRITFSSETTWNIFLLDRLECTHACLYGTAMQCCLCIGRKGDLCIVCCGHPDHAPAMIRIGMFCSSPEHRGGP
jgi:hypothetical protein